MNSKIVILLSCVLSPFILAQSIEGVITDKNNQYVPEIEVLLTKDNEKFSAITDEKGMFKISLKNNGNYLFEVIRNGVKINTEKIIITGSTKKNIQLTEVPIEQKIEGVTVTAKKKLFERKVDRLIFNIENSVAAQGTDIIEALAKTPMVRTTDNAITIAGKSNVAVMFNDKLLNLSGQELINYLKTLRSDDIAKIEIITTPPAKYEAEGKSGLINIILKKNTRLGWNGSIQTSGNYYFGRPTVSTRNGISFNYQGSKLSMTANLSVGDIYWQSRYNNMQTGINNPDFRNVAGINISNYQYKSGNLKAEYSITGKSVLGINYNYSLSNPLETSESTSTIFNNNTLLNIQSDYANKNHRNLHNATVFYDLKLDTLGSRLSLSANLLFNNSNARNFSNTVTSNTISTFANPISRYRIYSGQADLEKKNAKIKTEAGLKYTRIKNNSDFNFFNIQDGIYTFNTDRSNTFAYNEENYSMYGSAGFKLSEKWDVKAGLRYEYTHLEGISPNTNITTKINYGKFFPTTYLRYTPTENNTISINYSRRISRPYFGDLNPFRYYSSEYEYSTGNPFLLPTFSDNFELSYVLKSNLNITLYYNYSKNDWRRIRLTDETTRYTIPINFYNENQVGVNVSYNYNKLKWLESNIFVNGFYFKPKSFRPEFVIGPGGYSANFNFDNNFFLTQEKNFILMLGIWNGLPGWNGNTKYAIEASVYMGMKLNLMRKSLMINLNLNDVFNTNRQKNIEYYPDYIINSYYKGITRNMYLSITYKFGNNDIKGAAKQTKFEESNRVGN